MVETKLDSFMRSAEVVVSRAAGLRTNGQVASIRTQEYSLQVIRETCRRLHTLGFYLADVNGLSRKHIDAVVGSWHSQGLTNKTMQNQFSRIKIFVGWLGKPWLVSEEGAIGHLPGVDPKSLKVRTIADASKSWTENGIDLADVIKRATSEDPRLGAMLTLGIAFGLRKKEMLRIKPWKADKGISLEIDGSVAKNGRYRNIAFEAEEFGQAQRLALDQAKRICRKYDTLGWPGLSFKQAENKYYYHLKRLGITKFDSGVTGHGLRAEFAENILLLHEITPATLGGQKGQVSKAELDRVLKEISDKMGHSDLHAIGAYFGTFRAGMHISGLGLRFGSVFIIDESKDIFATVHCNPPVVRLKDGTYKQRSAEDIGNTCITFVVEQDGLVDRKVSLVDFIGEFSAQSMRVHREMLKVGLGKREPGSN
jgi:site-specific recombinase XerC